MKRGKFLAVLAFSLALVPLPACKPRTVQPANSTSADDSANTSGPQGSTPSATTPPTPDNFRRFHGGIEDKKIALKLNREGDQLSGTYQYQHIGKDIPVKGTIDKKGAFTMQEFGDGGDKPTGFFKGTWDESDQTPYIILSGEWSKSQTDKNKLNFWASEELVNSSLKIEDVMIKEEVKKPKVTIDATYPRIAGSSNPNAEKFNQLMKSEMTKMAADFKKESGDDADIPPEMNNGSSFDAGYTVFFANDDLISVEFDISPYNAGAAHPGHSMQVYNYDLKNGKLWKLSDMFKPGANYLAALSKYCTDNLLKRLKPDGGMGSDPDWIKNGAGPKEESYGNWNITKKGFLISFAPYEVASYADGPQYVTIPYSQLKAIVNPSGPIAGF